MRHSISTFIRNESGATAIEYGLISAFIGTGIIVGLTSLKGALNTLFASVVTNLN